jgi:hypothetical protein
MESIEKQSVGGLFVDNFFLYLFSLILGALTLFLLFWISAQNAGWAGIGIALWFFILFVPCLIFLSVIYLIILKTLLSKHPLPRSWKYGLYPLTAIIAIGLFFLIYSAFPH